MPYIYVIEDSDIIYLNYAETMKQSNVYTFADDNLFIFDLSKDELRTILSLTYGIDRNGNVYGPSINYCGGNRNSVFFQIVESEDGAFDSSNTSTLYSFNYARNDDYYENVFDILSIDEMKMN